LGLPGGTVLIGNGRMPNFNSSRCLAKGYFYAFHIDAVDDEHFPTDKVKDMLLVLGVSRVPASHRSCERPMYAYEVPGTVLIGYGGHLIDKGKWTKTSWDPRNLQAGDEVGVLIAEDGGDIVVYVNEEQVLRVRTSLNDKRGVDETNQSLADLESELPASPSSDSRKNATPKRVLYPILDLHGRVCAVTLLNRKAPPNVPLKPRNKLP